MLSTVLSFRNVFEPENWPRPMRRESFGLKFGYSYGLLTFRPAVAAAARLGDINPSRPEALALR
jgi:hypothetical protein